MDGQISMTTGAVHAAATNIHPGSEVIMLE